MAALAVVERLDVFEHGGLELEPVGPGAAVDELFFEGGEERLGDGVVVGVSAGAHRDRDPGLVRGAAERERDVLAALVGVVDQPWVGASAREGHPERVDDQGRAHVGGHRPADDQPRVGVLDGGEVQPALAGAQVGDVSGPQHVRTRRVEVALDEVGGRGDPGDPDRGLPPLSRPDACDTGGFHQPGDALASDPDVVLELELGVDPRRPIHPATGVVDLPDPLGQPHVAQSPV